MAIKKKTYSFRGGDIIDTEEYHDGKYGAPGEKRIKRKKATPEEMERVNKRNKEKRCRQRMLTYFREGDLFATLTYKVEERPPDMASAKKDFSKFIRKIRTEYKKRDVELYWIRNIEMGTRGAWHIHLIVNNTGDTASLIQKVWEHGGVYIHDKRWKNYRNQERRHRGKAESQGIELLHLPEYAASGSKSKKDDEVEEKGKTKGWVLYSTHA